MKHFSLFALSLITALPAVAEEARQLGAHEHGVGQLDIAFEGTKIAMELHAPGADIVGFEYTPTTDEDKAAIATALDVLTEPLDLFAFSPAANCTVVSAQAELEFEGAHDDHDEDAHHEDKELNDHQGEDHDDHDEDDHHDAHEDEDHHEDHHDEEEAGHTEFHAEYLLECANPSALTDINFTYFNVFPNALEVETQTLTTVGASSFEIERDKPTLDLRKLF